MANHRKPHPLTIESTREMENPSTANLIHMEKYVLGFGYIGSRKFPKRRRFLRTRSENGICNYFYLTSPNKGKRVMVVNQYVPIKVITQTQARKIFT